MSNPKFTESLNLQGAGASEYTDFIRRIRNMLAAGHSHGIPVLPLQGLSNDFFDLILDSGNTVMRVRVRVDNLYILGFRAEGGSQWYEWNNRNNRHDVDSQSMFLGFDGTYSTMENIAQLRSILPLGQLQLVTAVNHLANNNASRVERARSAIVLIQMISEAIRFSTISEFIASNYEAGARPTTQVVALENGWGQVSNAILRGDQDPTLRFIFRHEDMRITDLASALAVMGILLRYSVPRFAMPTLDSLDAVDDISKNDSPWVPVGRPLAEVFAVRINDIDGENPGDLYGRVSVTDGLSSQNVYRRDRSSYESIKPGNNALLTGPARAISAADTFTIDLSLWDKDADASPDDQVSVGTVLWNVFDPTKYDEVQNGTVKGDYGSATVSYAVMSNAEEATIQVILLDGDGESPADVYGTIKARTKLGEITLFNRAAEDHISARPSNAIPLLRGVASVPIDDELVIDTNLWDHDSDWSPDDEIARGSALFTPRVQASDKKTVAGVSGKVEVRITWGGP